MNLTEINPYMRFARIQKGKFPKYPAIAPDHRLFFCISGKCILSVDGKTFEIKKGALIFWKSGVVYDATYESEDLTMLGCNFDFFTNEKSPKTPVSYVHANIFKKSMLTENTHRVNALPSCIVLEHAPVEYIMRDIIKEYTQKELYYDSKCSALLKEVITITMRIYQSGENPGQKNKTDNILKYIRDHYNESLTNTKISEVFFYHPNYISSVIKKRTGVPLHKYLLQYRIHMATVMLQTSDISVTEVAGKVGFDDIKHFSKCFKKITGVSPSSYKQ